MGCKQELEMTLEEIAKQENIGYSATIGIEVSPMPNLLPTGSLYQIRGRPPSFQSCTPKEDECALLHL